MPQKLSNTLAEKISADHLIFFQFSIKFLNFSTFTWSIASIFEIFIVNMSRIDEQKLQKIVDQNSFAVETLKKKSFR